MKFSATSILRCLSNSKAIYVYVNSKDRLGNALLKYIDGVFESYIAVCSQKPASQEITISLLKIVLYFIGNEIATDLQEY